MTLVDSNVLIDLLQDDPVWADWSYLQLRVASASGAVVINPVVYAELSANFKTAADLNRFLNNAKVVNEPIGADAAFLAGQAFLSYRRRKGHKTGVLPDFLIGAHAQDSGYALLTRDVGRYQTYFPSVKLICP